MNSISQYDQALEAAQYIRSRYEGKIDFAVVLGSGLSQFEREIESLHTFSYSELPHFPESTVKGHHGKLIIGRIGDRVVICQSGRFHYYEGYSARQVTFPIRVFQLLGIDQLIVTNAAGGLDPQQEVGDIVIIRDHINLQPEHPLRGPNDERFGPRFPDMMRPYYLPWVDQALDFAQSQGYRVMSGVYVGVQGPTFETPAEYTYYHRIGGHAIGMSTVPEVIVAVHGGMKVFGASIIADCGYPPEKMIEVSHDWVLQQAAAAEPKVTAIVKHIIAQ